MKEEQEILNEILKEAQKTNRLLNEIKNAISAVAKKMLPENRQEEVVLKGGPVAEITVYSPDKLKEWMKIFESKGLRVEFSEPSSGEKNYFAKVWGYLEKPENQEDKNN
jgi:N-acetylglucosamine kinase-like BadF-type ATPase